jgi:hypothetical protein
MSYIRAFPTTPPTTCLGIQDDITSGRMVTSFFHNHNGKFASVSNAKAKLMLAALLQIVNGTEPLKVRPCLKHVQLRWFAVPFCA